MIVTKASEGTVEETVSRLEDLIAERGLELFLVVDHSGAAEAARLLAVRHEGRLWQPGRGDAVMQAAPLAAEAIAEAASRR